MLSQNKSWLLTQSQRRLAAGLVDAVKDFGGFLSVGPLRLIGLLVDVDRQELPAFERTSVEDGFEYDALLGFR